MSARMRGIMDSSDFRKSEKKELNKTEKRLNPKEINRIWKEAYRANPRAYEMENGNLLIGFAITEDTDSIFPLYPEKQWAAEGKTIEKWIITMISLTKPQDRIIGQMEYHEAMKRLHPYVIKTVDDYWILIRAMTHSELDGLFEGLPRKIV